MTRHERWALAAAIVVAAIAARGGPIYLFAGLVYVAVVLSAVRVRTLVIAQVIGGQILVALLLLQGVLHPLAGAAMAGLVIVTAELLAEVDSHDRGRLRRTLQVAGLAAAVYLAVQAIALLPGPGGSTGILVAAGACVVLAALATGRAHA